MLHYSCRILLESLTLFFYLATQIYKNPLHQQSILTAAQVDQLFPSLEELVQMHGKYSLTHTSHMYCTVHDTVGVDENHVF